MVPTTIIKTLTAEELKIIYKTKDDKYQFEIKPKWHNILSYLGLIKYNKKFNRKTNLTTITYTWNKNTLEKLYKLHITLFCIRMYSDLKTLKELENEIMELYSQVNKLPNKIYKYKQEY